MAVIQDPTTAVGTKVSAAGAVHTTSGSDGFPTFVTRFGSTTFTAIAAAGTYVWAMRAPATKTVVLRSGIIRMSHNPLTGAATTSIIEFVRFSGADPGGGTLLVPTPKVVADGAAMTVAVREAASASLVTLTGATISGATSGFNSLGIPNGVSAHGDRMLDDLSGGFILAPGEGLAIRAVTALPVGVSISGFVQFSER